jgi:hypothetical protein
MQLPNKRNYCRLDVKTMTFQLIKSLRARQSVLCDESGHNAQTYGDDEGPKSGGAVDSHGRSDIQTIPQNDQCRHEGLQNFK